MFSDVTPELGTMSSPTRTVQLPHLRNLKIVEDPLGVSYLLKCLIFPVHTQLSIELMIYHDELEPREWRRCASQIAAKMNPDPSSWPCSRHLSLFSSTKTDLALLCRDSAESTHPLFSVIIHDRRTEGESIACLIRWYMVVLCKALPLQDCREININYSKFRAWTGTGPSLMTQTCNTITLRAR